jgi:hypothetical protein
LKIEFSPLKSHNQRLTVNKKKRVTRTVIMLSSVFIIFWFPVHALSIWYQLDVNSFPRNATTYIFKLLAHTLSYSICTINPIIYSFSNETFNRSIVDLYPKIYNCLSVRKFKSNLQLSFKSSNYCRNKDNNQSFQASNIDTNVNDEIQNTSRMQTTRFIKSPRRPHTRIS